MSASSKKKLRNAQEAEKLTERQLTERKEAKKLKIYTAAFITVTVILLVIAIIVGVGQIIDRSGIRQKNSVAMTVGDQNVNALEMNYFYVDAVQNFCNTNSDILMYLLDTSTPLNEQVYSQTEGTTWADYFLSIAQSNAEYVYTLCAAAEAEGFTIPAADQLDLDNSMSVLDLYANMYSYPDADTYLKAIYGGNANEDDFYAYQERITLANAYRNDYYAKLIIDDAAIEEAQKDSYDNYSSFTFNSYYISASRFLEGGTEDANGTVTHTPEETAAAAAAAEEAAKHLCEIHIDSVEAFDTAIAALPVNAETPSAKSTPFNAALYTSIDATMAKWLVEEHAEGEIGYVAKESTVDGVTTVDGYYVLYFISREDNEFFLPNVRHILIGSPDVVNGTTAYTDEDLATYKAEAETLLQQWKDGEATEESFAALASEKSIDTGSVANGGLYEGILPGQMVEAFNDWCFQEHQVGDTDIVETSFGYHIMYFCGLSEQTYRDQMVTETLTTERMETWFEELSAKYPMTLGETTYLPMDMVITGQ